MKSSYCGTAVQYRYSTGTVGPHNYRQARRYSINCAVRFRSRGLLKVADSTYAERSRAPPKTLIQAGAAETCTSNAVTDLHTLAGWHSHKDALAESAMTGQLVQDSRPPQSYSG